jgi:hypothetical protein
MPERRPWRRACAALGVTVALSGCSLILDFGGGADGQIDAAPGGAIDGAPADGANPTSDDAGLDASFADVGCADGEREGFLDLDGEPNIAGCSGGFAVAGVITVLAPGCARAAGDDGANPNGDGCNVTDLCAVGWHVCATPAEVAASSFFGTCAGAVADGAAEFFTTRASGTGGYECNGGSNDLFGCGSTGYQPVAVSCAPLDRSSGNLCEAVADWNCGGGDGTNEAGLVTKPAPGSGGVLCCRDPSD